jgi:drug/metabolite transporter (DMT)-like permease
MVVGVAVVFYFSWIPEPRLSLSEYMPAWLSQWTDNETNMNLRTAIPFVFLGVLVAVWLLRTNQSWYRWIAGWLLLVAVVVVAEAGQLLLPLRHFDWGDIGWGAVGAAAGLLVCGVPAILMKLIKATI